MKSTWLVFLVVVFVALALWPLSSGISPAQSSTAFDSPLILTLTASVPTPAPTRGPSAEAQKALQYISEREGIPLEGLFVVNDLERTFPLLGRTFRAVLILDIRTHEGQEYYVLVDLADGRIEEDWEAIEATADAAYRDKYGKFHPALYEWIQKAGDDDLLPVAIWVAPNAQVRTREQVYAELAARYPEAAVALEREGTPWAVDDPALAQEIREAYRRMRAEDTAVRVEPLVEYLSERGFEARTFGAMPSVSAVLSKRVIVELAEREDVGLIYLTEEQGSDEADTAASTSQVLTGRERTFSGWGGLVAAAAVWGLALPLIYLSRRASKPTRKRLLGVVIATATALTLALLYLTACRPRDNELSFETIERLDEAGTGERWGAREPGLMVIAASQDLAQIDNLFTADAQDQLRELDLNAYFAVAAFLGVQGAGHEGIQIERVVRREDDIAVYVQVGRRRGEDTVTSPYHLIKIRKEGNWNRMIHFTLYLDGTETISLSHSIP